MPKSLVLKDTTHKISSRFWVELPWTSPLTKESDSARLILYSRVWTQAKVFEDDTTRIVLWTRASTPMLWASSISRYTRMWSQKSRLSSKSQITRSHLTWKVPHSSLICRLHRQELATSKRKTQKSKAEDMKWKNLPNSTITRRLKDTIKTSMSKIWTRMKPLLLSLSISRSVPSSAQTQSIMAIMVKTKVDPLRS